MPIQAYIDESGGKGQKGFLTAVGVLGRAKDWASFSDRWRAVLDLPPKIQSLHMFQAALLEGDFKGWRASDRDERVHRLVELVNDYDFTAIHCSVDIAAYRDLMRSTMFQRIPTKRKSMPREYRKSNDLKHAMTIDEPYFLCFNIIAIAIGVELLDQGVTERCEIFFDENPKLGKRAKAWYPFFRERLDDEMRAIMPIEPFFRDDAEYEPLQLSDALAWIKRKDLGNEWHSFDWLDTATRQLEWSEHSQIFDRDRLEEIEGESS